MKRSNINRHFDTRHAKFASKYPAGTAERRPVKSLNDRQFKTLPDEVGNNYPDLLLHSNVCWLSRGKVLSRFAARLSEIFFLNKKCRASRVSWHWVAPEVPLSRGHDWTSNPDQCENARHWKYNLIPATSSVCIWKQARTLYRRQLNWLFITLWKTCSLKIHAQQVTLLINIDLQQLAGFTSNLQSFKSHFGEFRDRTRHFRFITHPHECAVDSADLSYIPGVSVFWSWATSCWPECLRHVDE